MNQEVKVEQLGRISRISTPVYYSLYKLLPPLSEVQLLLEESLLDLLRTAVNGPSIKLWPEVVRVCPKVLGFLILKSSIACVRCIE